MPLNQNSWYVGSPGCGKSNAWIADILPHIGYATIVLFDWMKETAELLTDQLIEMQFQNVVVDDLDDEFGFRIEMPGRFESEQEQDEENDACCEAVYHGDGYAFERPIIYEILRLFFDVYTKLPTDFNLPIYEAIRMFGKNDPVRTSVIRSLPDCEERFALEQISALAAPRLIERFGPATRYLQKTIGKPATRNRLGVRGYRWEDLLDQRVVLIIKGGSPEVFKAVTNILSRQIIKAAMKTETQVIIAYEEAFNTRIVGPFETSSLLLVRKTNVALHVLSQQRFPDLQLREQFENGF